MGIITLFHAVFQVWRVNSHIRHGRINIHRCAYVRTVCLSGEKLLFHKPGRARSDRLCATFFRTLFSSPLVFFAFVCLSSHCVFTRIRLPLPSPKASLHILSCFLFSFCFTFPPVCFFPPSYLFLLKFPFMVSVTAPPWSLHRLIALYRLPLFCFNGATGHLQWHPCWDTVATLIANFHLQCLLKSGAHLYAYEAKLLFTSHRFDLGDCFHLVTLCKRVFIRQPWLRW